MQWRLWQLSTFELNINNSRFNNNNINNSIYGFYQNIDEDTKNGTANALRRSIVKLEEHYKLASDNAHKGLKGMNSASHHLDDLAHHPTFWGLIAAIVGEVFRAGVLVDKNGHWHQIIVPMKCVFFQLIAEAGRCSPKDVKFSASAYSVGPVWSHHR